MEIPNYTGVKLCVAMAIHNFNRMKNNYSLWLVYNKYLKCFTLIFHLQKHVKYYVMWSDVKIL